MSTTAAITRGTLQTERQTDRGAMLDHSPGPEHGVVSLRVVVLVPNQRVEWECITIGAS